ncbi:putative peptidoglycan lipid II flippase [Thermocatellispora tengchongensis]|uniref:Putative peptidoglycan lipid II flippase n=1 Tax=Thermocatellispora tengchongensis TaxID=1073253 RepID=A0A840P7F1_9ACTN|nr:lipid II flippase MurJ [Thermocatellispora tengchongensis]MBB5133370.1 putative peptidoglycan lipid II flippase [Thermocatellispora tengchongensis]
MTSATPRAGHYARAAALTGALTVLGSLLGFGRDLLLAATFGADTRTDAFLVAWMVPETAAPLLIEGAMAFVLIPLFTRSAANGQDLRPAVTATLPPIALLLAGAAALTALAAPWLVHLLAPGIADPDLAARCMRLTAPTILAFGLAGYASAALRSRERFAAPAAIYAVYNIGIIACTLTGHDRLGVLAAALGVMIGGLAMVAAQAPAFARHVGLPGGVRPVAVALPLAAFAPVAVYTLLRQGQVVIERLFGSTLGEGAISHLNYAQKIAQLPMVLSLALATVTFPRLARHIAARDAPAAARRLAGDLTAAAVIVLPATAALVVFAPEIVAVLLQHGAFTGADTAATAHVMRLYSLGLLGQAVVGVACRAYFCGTRPSRFPITAMAAGLAATAVLAALAVRPWGAGGIALANAAGITLTAVILLRGLRAGRAAGVAAPAVGPLAARFLAAAVAAAAAGWLARTVCNGLSPAAVLVVGLPAAALAFAAVMITRYEELIRMIDPREGGR